MNRELSFSDVLQTVGRTPIVPLRHIVPLTSAAVFGKLETSNPTSSLKDRVALGIIESLEKKGILKKNTPVVCATSGNTGVALGLVCAVRGYSLNLFMPADASLEKRRMFEGFGARLILTPAEKSVQGAKDAAQAFVAKNPDAIVIDQFDNPDVVCAHEKTTAQEICGDFPDGIDAFVMGVGTAGTITGVARVLKKRFPKILIVAVEPSASAVLSGGKPGISKIQQLGLGFVPGNFDRSLVDRIMTVSDTDAYMTTRRLSRKEGLLLGISSGANVFASLKVAEELGPRAKVLTIFCDAGQRYFSLKKFFEG